MKPVFLLVYLQKLLMREIRKFETCAICCALKVPNQLSQSGQKKGGNKLARAEGARRKKIGVLRAEGARRKK